MNGTKGFIGSKHAPARGLQIDPSPMPILYLQNGQQPPPATALVAADAAVATSATSAAASPRAFIFIAHPFPYWIGVDQCDGPSATPLRYGLQSS